MILQRASIEHLNVEMVLPENFDDIAWDDSRNNFFLFYKINEIDLYESLLELLL